jgi:hypothetical protein
MSNTGRIFAVITGDIIRSRELDTEARKRLQRVLTSDISARLREAFPEALVMDMDVFRGDSWQLLIRAPHLALRIAFFCRAYIKAALAEKQIDSRMGIGLGTVAVMPRKRVSDGDGDAFRHSGNALDEMSRSRHLALAGSGSRHLRCLDVLTHLGDAVSGRWTDRQAIAVLGALQDLPQEEIRGLYLWGRGKKNPLSQQAVAKHLKSAQWEAIQSGLAFFEDALLGGNPMDT